MGTFSSTASRAYKMPYSTAKYGWRFLNFVHLLSGRGLMQPLMFRPDASVTLGTMTQKLRGGRNWLLNADEPDAQQLVSLRPLFECVVVKETETSAFIAQKERFTFVWQQTNAAKHWFFTVLRTIDGFIVSQSPTLVHPTVLMPEQACEAIRHYIQLRPQIRSYTVGETFITLSK